MIMPNKSEVEKFNAAVIELAKNYPNVAFVFAATPNEDRGQVVVAGDGPLIRMNICAKFVVKALVEWAENKLKEKEAIAAVVKGKNDKTN